MLRSEITMMPDKRSIQKIHDELVNLRNQAVDQEMDVSAHFIDVAIESVIRESGDCSWERLDGAQLTNKVVPIRP